MAGCLMFSTMRLANIKELLQLLYIQLSQERRDFLPLRIRRYICMYVCIVVYRGSLVVYNVVLGDEGNPWVILVHTSVPANVAPETRNGKREPDLFIPGSAA